MMNLEETLQNCMTRNLSEKRHKLALFIEKMKGLSPLEKLNQGYSYTADSQGRTVYSINQVEPGEKMQVYVKDGVIHTEVLDRQGMAFAD